MARTAGGPGHVVVPRPGLLTLDQGAAPCPSPVGLIRDIRVARLPATTTPDTRHTVRHAVAEGATRPAEAVRRGGLAGCRPGPLLHGIRPAHSRHGGRPTVRGGRACGPPSRTQSAAPTSERPDAAADGRTGPPPVSPGGRPRGPVPEGPGDPYRRSLLAPARLMSGRLRLRHDGRTATRAGAPGGHDIHQRKTQHWLGPSAVPSGSEQSKWRGPVR